MNSECVTFFAFLDLSEDFGAVNHEDHRYSVVKQRWTPGDDSELVEIIFL